MEYRQTTALDETQKNQIKALVDACRLAEPVTLSAPLEDGLYYYLGYEQGELVSMVFLFFPEETVCECGAFTLPDQRRKGYFSELLEEALAFVEGYEKEHGVNVDFCFLSDRKSADARETLQAMGAEYWYSEYSMSLELPEAGELQLPADVSNAGSVNIVQAEDGLYTAVLDNRSIGVCMVIPNGDSVYFYGFEIKRAFRRMGYGQSFLNTMIRLLSKDYRRLTLQVSSLNTAALSLYRKTGFRVTETLSYYLY